jgi:hypothetical protein
MKIANQHKGLKKWNRKVHIYLGLFLLLFIWLFGISGVLLNHHWAFSNSWEKKVVTTYEETITVSELANKQFLVDDIMGKLNLKGSIFNPKYSSDSTRLSFIAAKPGVRYDIDAGLIDGNILIKESRFDQWDVMKTLHKLRNPTSGEQGYRYHSLLSSVWSFSMDVVSVGLIIICLGGWYLWWQASKRRFYLGLISIASGFVLCLYILFF